MNYSDLELLQVVQMVNEIHPYSFGIVDTYGAMYMDDVDRLYELIDHNMLPDICINFHSHNSYQLSFAFAQEIIKLSANSTRQVIIDGTLLGIGKVAGNLNMELLVEFLNRKMKYSYDLDKIFDTIDEYIHKYTLEYRWGYSIPALKDIGKLLCMIDPAKRQRYDYDNIKKLYIEYNHTKVDDTLAIGKLHNLLKNRNILLLLPGHSIVDFENEIKKYIEDNNAFLISVNFVSQFGDIDDRMTFYGSTKRYKNSKDREQEKNVIVVSNVENYLEHDIVVNYESLIERNNSDFDNTMIMLLNLLRRMNIKKFAIAGFDGYHNGENNYFDDSKFQGNRFQTKYGTVTDNMRKMLSDYAMALDKKEDVEFLTPSVYADIFKD